VLYNLDKLVWVCVCTQKLFCAFCEVSEYSKGVHSHRVASRLQYVVKIKAKITITLHDFFQRDVIH